MTDLERAQLLQDIETYLVYHYPDVVVHMPMAPMIARKLDLLLETCNRDDMPPRKIAMFCEYLYVQITADALRAMVADAATTAAAAGSDPSIKATTIKSTKVEFGQTPQDALQMERQRRLAMLDDRAAEIWRVLVHGMRKLSRPMRRAGDWYGFD